MTTQDTVREIEAQLRRLDPRAVANEVDVMIGARVQAWRASGALARSSEQALPLPDRVDRWVLGRSRRYARALDEMLRQLDTALALQDELLVRLTLADAQELAEATAGVGAATCANCSRVWVPDPGDRIISGRCFACYEYRRRHEGIERPRRLWEEALL